MPSGEVELLKFIQERRRHVTKPWGRPSGQSRKTTVGTGDPSGVASVGRKRELEQRNREAGAGQSRLYDSTASRFLKTTCDQQSISRPAPLTDLGQRRQDSVRRRSGERTSSLVACSPAASTQAKAVRSPSLRATASSSFKPGRDVQDLFWGRCPGVATHPVPGETARGC